jgi:putative heme-binding domain-containing protein
VTEMRTIIKGALVFLSLAGLPGGTPPARGQDPFAENVRSTAPLSPQDQLRTFELPTDLAIDLIAAEPVIQKPLNMAFDAQGRLWMTCTVEYPYPAKAGQGRDRVVVLEDTNGDGQFDRHTVFATDLNIPIGILPMGNDCLVFDIPYIWKMSDTNGDGRCDHKVPLLGPFDCSRDTHGMNNSFIQGFDGWVYACHGFANRSQVAGTDGHQVTLNSGNVYRFRPDGSRIEHFSHGQVNPFGMACDDWFALFTADCHSKPLTQVLRGAFYPSFGAPHDGLGFAPSMMEHFHGSTAIAGVEVISSGNFPATYEGQVVSGNVMTSRINRNHLQWNGASVQAIELPDLLSTADPWFRPVHLIQGPDGGLYVADFYNRIIGHYEVPLEHPGRDRERGRIWRIRAASPTRELGTERAADDAATDPQQSAVANAAENRRDALWGLLQHEQVRTRLAAVNALVALGEAQSSDAVWLVDRCRQVLQEVDDPRQLVAGLWCLSRLSPSQVDAALLSRLQEHASPVVRGHVQRVLAEAWPGGHGTAANLPPTDRPRPVGPGGVEAVDALPPGRGPALPLSDQVFQQLIAHGLRDEHPRVVQLAADAAGRNPSAAMLRHLLSLAADPQRDPVVVHTARIALKQALLPAEGPRRRAADAAGASPTALWNWIRRDAVAQQWQPVLAGIMLAIPNAEAAEYLLDYVTAAEVIDPRSAEMIQHIAKHLPAARSADLVRIIQAQFSGDVRIQWELLGSIGEGLARGGQATPAPVREWALQLVGQAVREIVAQGPVWQSLTLDGRPFTQANEDAWRVQQRPVLRREKAATDDGPVAVVPMYSSLPAGEQRTGILRSPPFSLPESLALAIAGHRGYPDQPAHELNRVQLVLADGTVIQTAFPPRHDAADWVHWDLQSWQGQTAQLEIQDGDAANAYAWLAVGQFQPPVLTVSAWPPSELASYIQGLCRVAVRFRLTEVVPALQSLLEPGALAISDRWWIAQTVADLNAQGFARAFAAEMAREDLPLASQEEMVRLVGFWRPECLTEPPAEPLNLAVADSPAAQGYLLTLLPKLSGRQQKLLVRAAINEAEVFELILGWAETGRLSAESFDDPAVRQQITLTGRGDWPPRVAKLLQELPPIDEAWVARVRQAEQKFKPWLEHLNNSGTLSPADVELDSELAQQAISRGERDEWKRFGQQVFQRDCAACHQLAGQGAVVGPQLDGIHRRGLERVLEDVLLPNQNVDHAFRSHMFLLDNGQVLVGLVQAEDELSVQITDQQGKPLTIPVEQIDQRQVTPQSLMPGDVAHQYSDATLFGLMFFLLDQVR